MIYVFLPTMELQKKKTESKAVQTTSSISMEGPITNALSTHDYIYIQMTQDVSDETLT